MCYSDDMHPWKAPESHLGAEEASAARHLLTICSVCNSLAMCVISIPAAECCPLASYEKQVYFVLTGRLRIEIRVLARSGGHFLVCNWLSFLLCRKWQKG